MSSDNRQTQSDLTAVFLSFLAGIIQLLLFVVGTLGQVTRINNLFYRPDIIPFLVLLSLIVALCIVGVVSFIKKNPNFIVSQSNFRPSVFIKKLLFIDGGIRRVEFSKKKEITWLVLALLLLIYFVSMFILTTLQHVSGNEILFINKSNGEIIQSFSFVFLWILTTVILFVWISNEIEKRNQFKQEDFIPNMIRSLQSQGYVHIVIKSDLIIPNDPNHLVCIDIQGTTKYFIVQFDGRVIVRELTKAQYGAYFNPPVSPRS